jgi:hypothetical protein
MSKADASMSKPGSAANPSGSELPTFRKSFAGPSGNAVTTWPDYMVDAFQRSVLFLDLLRRRGNEEIEITSRPMATVLSFGHEVLMDGRSLPGRSTTRCRASLHHQGSQSIRTNARS